MTIQPGDPNADAWRGLHRDFQQQQATMTRLQQQRQQAPQQPAAPAAPTPAPAGMTPDLQQARAALTDAERAQFDTTFFENPTLATQQLLERLLPNVLQGQSAELKPVLEYINQQKAAQQVAQQQFQVQQAAESELAAMAADTAQFPDLQQLTPIMSQVAQMYPHLTEGPSPMQTIYRLARGYMGSTPTPQPALTVDSVLQNAELIQQLRGDPRFMQPTIAGYLEAMRTGQQLPVMIAAAAGGVAPAMPGAMPRTIREGTKAFLASLGQQPPG